MLLSLQDMPECASCVWCLSKYFEQAEFVNRSFLPPVTFIITEC